MQLVKWIHMHVVLGMTWNTNYKYIWSTILRTSEARGKVKENHLKFLYLIIITENIWNLKQTYLSCYVVWHSMQWEYPILDIVQEMSLFRISIGTCTVCNKKPPKWIYIKFIEFILFPINDLLVHKHLIIFIVSVSKLFAGELWRLLNSSCPVQ